MPSVSAGGSRVDLKNQKKTLKEEKDEEKNPTTLLGKGRKGLNDHIESNGGIVGTLGFWLMLVAIVGGCYYGYKAAKDSPFNTEFIKPYSAWTRIKLGELWVFLLSLPGIIYNWTIGWFTFLTRPRIREQGKIVNIPGQSNPAVGTQV
jgi:hypothetical protein